MPGPSATPAPVSFLDHLRASAAAPAPQGVIAPEKTKQIAAAVERTLHAFFGPDFTVEHGDQQTASAASWLSSLDAAGIVLAQLDEESPGKAALLTLDRRTAILMTTAQFGGASMLGLTDTGRPLSRLEEGFLTSFGAALLPSVQPQAIAASAPRLLGPQAASALIPGDAEVNLFVFFLVLGETRLSFCLAMPSDSGEQSVGAVQEAPANAAWKSAVGTELTRSKVRIDAVVDLTTLPLSRLRILIAGDIIPIPEGALGRTALVSRGETLLTGRLGKLAGAYTVRVTAAALPKTSPLHGLMQSAGVHVNSRSDPRQ